MERRSTQVVYAELAQELRMQVRVTPYSRRRLAGHSLHRQGHDDTPLNDLLDVDPSWPHWDGLAVAAERVCASWTFRNPANIRKDLRYGMDVSWSIEEHMLVTGRLYRENPEQVIRHLAEILSPEDKARLFAEYYRHVSLSEVAAVVATAARARSSEEDERTAA